MKKIYTLIALAFAAMSANADVVLTMGGEVCDPAKTVEIYAELENDGTAEEPDVWIEWGSSDPKIKNTGTTDANVSITVTTNEPKGTFMWCGPMTMTQQCMPLAVPTETRSGVLKAGVEDPLVLDIIAYDWGPEYYASHALTLTIKEGSKSTTYNLNYIYDASCDEKAGLSSGVNTVLRGEDKAPRYDLQGRRTSNTATGLFIKGGRKYIK